MKTILLCGNGLSGEIIPSIKEWGYKVCLMSEFPDDRGTRFCDHFERVNTFNPKASLEAAKRMASNGWTFDAVLSLCWDCPISVSRIAEHFGLMAVKPEVAERATYKHLRIRALSEAGLPVSRFAVLDMREPCAADLEALRYPLVCKPVDLSGATGVQLIESPAELVQALRITQGAGAVSFCPKILVEEFLEGTEYSAEGIMIGGNFHQTGLSERVFDKKARPSFIEIGDIMPTLLDTETKEEIRSLCEKAALALGIGEGVVKYDLLLTDRFAPDQPKAKARIYILEVTPRLGGPRFGTEMIPLSNGTNILKAAIKQLLGEKIDMELLKSKRDAGMVAFTVFSSRTGFIRSIQGLEEIQHMDGYYDFKWWKAAGHKVGDRVMEGSKLGYYIVQAATRDEALSRARAVEDRIRIEVSP